MKQKTISMMAFVYIMGKQAGIQKPVVPVVKMVPVLEMDHEVVPDPKFVPYPELVPVHVPGPKAGPELAPGSWMPSLTSCL